MIIDFIKSWFHNPKHQNKTQKDEYYEEVFDFEKPKYIDVDGIKVEVENKIVGHTKLYGCDKNTNEICEEFITRMWKLKETIPLEISKFYVVDDDGKQYTCYLSENRKTLIDAGD